MFFSDFSVFVFYLNNLSKNTALRFLWKFVENKEKVSKTKNKKQNEIKNKTELRTISHDFNDVQSINIKTGKFQASGKKALVLPETSATVYIIQC